MAAQAGEVYYADDGTVSTVIDEAYDPSYEPTDQEIEEYAKYIGIDPATEPELLWLGRAGLKEPMPKEWKPCKTDTGDVYYFNFETGESIWDHPMDEVFKARCESERIRLKREGKSYQPPADAVKGKGKAAGAGPKKKASAADKVEKKLAEVDAKVGGTSGFASSTLSSLAPVSAVGKIPLATTKLNALSAGGPSSLATPGGAKPNGFSTGGIPSAFGGGGAGGASKLGSSLNAAAATASSSTPLTTAGGIKETEKRIRERLAPDYQAKITSLENANEKELEETNADLAAKLKKVERDLASQIDDEKDTAKRNAERKAKRELEEHEEALEKQREQLRKELRQLKEKVADAEVEASSASKTAEREAEAKKAEIFKQNEAEITKRRLEIHDAWRKEKDAAETKAQAELDAINSNFESDRKAVEAKESMQFSKQLEEEEADLQQTLQSYKAKLATQRREALEEIQRDAAAAGQAHSAAYTAAEKACETAISEAKAAAEEEYNAERTRHQQEMASLRSKHTSALHDATADAAMKQSEGAAVALRNAKNAANEAVEAVETELKAAFDEEMAQFDAETRQMEHRAREEANSKLQGDAAANAARIERARADGRSAAEEELSRLKAKQQREVSALEEEIAAAELAAARRGSTATADSYEVDALFATLKGRWISANPPEELGPLPTLPPAMSSANFDTGLSTAHKAEIAAAVALEKQRLMTEADAKVLALQRQLDGENTASTSEGIARSDAENRRKAEEYRRELQEELKRENDALHAQLAATTAAAASSRSTEAAIRASRRESKQIEKVLRRKRLRDDIESKHRLEQIQRDAEVNRRVDDEARRLQEALNATTTLLAQQQAALQLQQQQQQASFSTPHMGASATPPLPTLVDSRPVTPERQQRNRPPLAPTAGAYGGSGSNTAGMVSSSLPTSPLRDNFLASGMTSEHNTPSRLLPHQQQQMGSASFAGSGASIPMLVMGMGSSANDFGGSSGVGGGGFGSGTTFPSNSSHQHLMMQQQQQQQLLSGSAVMGGSGMMMPHSQQQQQYQTQQSQQQSQQSQQQLQQQPTIGERLAKAREVLRKKKKDIKSRQEQLENARADWRIDMAAAKHNKDQSAVNILMKIKKEMEGVAHQLNAETKDLLSAVEWLKEQEEAEGKRRAAAAMYAGSQKQNNQQGSGGDVNQILAQLAMQTMNMEQRMNTMMASGNHNQHHNGGGGKMNLTSNPTVDPMTSKWSNWLSQQGQSVGGVRGSSPLKGSGGGAHPTTRPSSAMMMMNPSSSSHYDPMIGGGNSGNGGHHNPHLDAWLQDQLAR